jgi:hypothetical protein
VRVSGSVVELGGLGFAWVFGLVALHLALALVMKQVRLVAGLHALATLAVGLGLCIGKSRPLKIAQWAAYVVGAEVLWRMCKAPIPWEFAKYSICLVCLIALMRSKEFRGRGARPLLRFVVACGCLHFRGIAI